MLTPQHFHERRTGAGLARHHGVLPHMLAIGLALALVGGLSGCSMDPSTWQLPWEQQSVQPSQAVVDAASSGVTQDGTPGALCRDTLSSQQQLVYDQMLATVQAHQESGVLSTDDSGSISTIYTDVLDDHPEIFWADGTGSYSTVAGQTTFKPSYSMTTDQQSQVQAQLDQVAQDFEATVPADADDYQKVKAAYTYVITTADYDTGAAHAHDLLGVLLDRRGVCDSYAKAVQWLLAREGVWCGFVRGTAGGGAHAWNVVLVDGKWCYVDATWGDPSFDNGGDANGPDITYGYLCVSGRTMTQSDHVPDSSYDGVLPDDADTTDAYDWYVLNDALVDSPDSTQAYAVAHSALSQAATSSDAYFSLKFTSEEAYQQAKQELQDGNFQQTAISEYLDGHPDVSTYTYATFDRIRMVWVRVG